MTIKEIPRSFLYTCDSCGLEHRQENAQGHYTESVPPHWLRIRIRKGVIDNLNGNFEHLLCKTCGPRMMNAIDRVMDNIKGEKEIKK